jgi:hypothetical protein
MRPEDSETSTWSPTLYSRGGSGLRAGTREIYDNRWLQVKGQVAKELINFDLEPVAVYVTLSY